MCRLEDSTDSPCLASCPAPALPREDSTFSDTSSGPLNGPDTQHTITNHRIVEENLYCNTETPITSKGTYHPAPPLPSLKKNPVFKNPIDELYSRMDAAEHRLRKRTGGTDESSQKRTGWQTHEGYMQKRDEPLKKWWKNISQSCKIILQTKLGLLIFSLCIFVFFWSSMNIVESGHSRWVFSSSLYIPCLASPCFTYTNTRD